MMNESVKLLCDALDELSLAVRDGWTDDQNLNEAFGWNHPATNRFDLAEMSSILADQIRKANVINDDENFNDAIDLIPDRLDVFKSSTLPQFYNGNGYQAIPAYTRHTSRCRF
jgi:hypothetical protein